MPAKIDGRTKTAVLKFIADFDAKNGRGGISAASRKYKITRVTITRWLKSEPSAKGKVKAKKAKAGRPAKVVKVAKVRKVRKAKKVVKAAKVVKAPKVKKAAGRRGRPAKAKSALRQSSGTTGMGAFAAGLIAVAELQSQIAIQMKKLAAVVA